MYIKDNNIENINLKFIGQAGRSDNYVVASYTENGQIIDEVFIYAERFNVYVDEFLTELGEGKLSNTDATQTSGYGELSEKVVNVIVDYFNSNYWYDYDYIE